MKIRKSNVKQVFLCILLVFSVSACGTKGDQGVFPSNYRIGVIETTEQKQKSIIGLYNDSFDLVDTLDYRMGSLGTHFYPPQTVGDKVYMIPQGLGNKKDLSVILALDMESGESETIKLGVKGASSFCVDDRFVFATATWNGDATISRTLLADKSIKRIKHDSVFVISQMSIVRDELFVVGVTLDGKSTFAIYDVNTMELISEMDFSKFGYSHMGMLHVKDNLYLTSGSKRSSNGEEVPDNRLIVYNLTSRKFHAIKLDATEPATMSYEEGKLYVLQSNLVSSETQGISIVDIASEETHFIALDHEANQIIVKDGFLYALSRDSLYTYKINGNDIKFLEEKNVQTQTGNNPYFYISCIFAR